MQALRPFAGAKRMMQRITSTMPCSTISTPTIGISHLNGHTIGPFGLADGMLVHQPRQLGEPVAGVDEGQHAGEEEEDVEHEVHARLPARRPGAIDEVAAHMALRDSA